MARHCAECQLCCRLLPVKPLQKGANVRCKYQKFGKGCTVYRTAKMPSDCAIWNCRWLLNDDTADLSRPDRSHYVIDIMPDFVTNEYDDGSAQKIPVVQIWCDPQHRQAHRDPALRRYLSRRGKEGYAAIIRYSDREAFVLMPPELCDDGQWHEVHSQMHERMHSFEEVLEVLSGAQA